MRSPAIRLHEAFGAQLQLTRRARQRLQDFDTIDLTQHSSMRLRQGGISELQIALMLAFGKSTPVGANVRSFFLDNASRRELQRVLGDKYAQVSDHTNYYLIVDADSNFVLTSCHRLRRLWR